ncbi:hypothetical protein BD413DRAFT_476339 [Trametes elegans]|nr:hypothetical protein BD413DRAFT_476339 [Trametes elegans]
MPKDADSSAHHADLSKLNVAQLKALCKERKIAGYSKLGKQALVQKLVDNGHCAGNSTNDAAVSEVPPAGLEPASTGTAPALANCALPAPSAATAEDTNQSRPSVRGQAAKKKKRAPPIDDTMPPSAKKSRIQSPAVTSKPASTTSHTPVATLKTAVQSWSSGHADISRPIPPASTVSTTGLTATAKPAAVIPNSTTVPAKRFKPLVIGKAKTAAATVTVQPVRTTLAAPATTVQVHTPESEAALRYLEFPGPNAALPGLRSITLPPPLAQRKRVNCWAVILSGLSDEERAACALVSRTFRYAVYLSASCILNRRYGGKRLEKDVLRQYSPAMTNMWPYLRIREAEAVERKRIYASSFLPRFFQRYGLSSPIAAHLWASPDDLKQLVVAVRFALTRAWFELSVGVSSGIKDDPTSWLNGMIVDAQEVVRDEIWAITLERPATATGTQRREAVYVLEATCEVVGRPAATEVGGSAALPIRADWSTYVRCRSTPSSDEPPLLSHLKWSCHEEFDHGVSRLWLKRVDGEGEIGAAKRVVAERYILACVVGNSISGEWMSASSMAHDFAGLPSRGVVPKPSRIPAVNLYLPEHHHVESVHFTSSGGSALHPALAVVQTPHREYFVLRDNGMQVGCEEDGVAGVWQEVFGCDGRGVAATPA